MEAQGCQVAIAHKWCGATGRRATLAWPTDPPAASQPGAGVTAAGGRDPGYRARHRVGAHRIGWALGEAQSTVAAVLTRHQVARLADLDRPTGTVVRYQRDRPGELVHVDVKKQGRVPDGGGWRVHGRGAGGNPNVKTGLGYDYGPCRRR